MVKGEGWREMALLQKTAGALQPFYLSPALIDDVDGCSGVGYSGGVKGVSDW